MNKNKCRTTARVAAAAGMALAVGAANAVVIDGPEGIGDRVWNDLDRDGIQDIGEPGLAGVTVNLLANDATLLDSTTTSDAAGEIGLYYFRFDDQGQFFQNYIVEFLLPAGFVFSPQSVGVDILVDSDADIITGRTDAIFLDDTNDQRLDIDAGIYRDPAIPSPAVLSLLGLGLAGLGLQLRRRSKKKPQTF